ncbi:hypothetical protein [Halomicrobium sp. LC1Hm]|uniref:hypothetical protein n=1 Tax=Halomicrobium sp. LC1Hm TaxID=2610902 RepID=UPI0012982843|nr:hypothetical protein [Halomicrobium sp. LC1Hm]QGA81993.1 HTH-domain containing transcriptional regulator [Halomicrobium sp. LC1Hm]
MTDDEELDDRDYSDTRWEDPTPRVNDEMTEREREVIDSRIDEIEDESRRHSTREVAEELGVEDIDALIDDLPDDA